MSGCAVLCCLHFPEFQVELIGMTWKMWNIRSDSQVTHKADLFRYGNIVHLWGFFWSQTEFLEVYSTAKQQLLLPFQEWCTLTIILLQQSAPCSHSSPQLCELRSTTRHPQGLGTAVLSGRWTCRHINWHWYLLFVTLEKVSPKSRCMGYKLFSDWPNCGHQGRKQGWKNTQRWGFG